MRICRTSHCYLFSLLGAVLLLLGCAEVSVPDSRSVKVPSPASADERKSAVNERSDSVMYLPLGDDILMPEILADESLPREVVGPFELRSETLAGALQLILADYDISLAFETDEGLDRRITVANLHGELDSVVHRVCSLADLYCSYENGVLVVKDTETFTVTLPPVGASSAGEGGGDPTAFLSNVAAGLSAVLGGSAAPIIDTTTRTIIYQATQRKAVIASRYFQRLRANTAMIVYEAYIWEVNLGAGNTVGIDWSMLDKFGKFNVSLAADGNVSANFTNPISIGLPTTQAIGATPSDMVQFLSTFGAVKSISQPQISVLSGSSAELRVANTENYVSKIATTLDGGGGATTSVDTDSVDSGFTLNIGSTWDRSTVYADVSVKLTDVIQIDNFVFSDGGVGGTSTSIQLPQTTERELNTQIRIRPGDSVLIAGLVQERDNFSKEGPGFMEPILPQSRTAETDNLELVILLRPRVVVYTPKDENAADTVAMSHNSSAVPAAALKSSALSDKAVEPEVAHPAPAVVKSQPVQAPAPAPVSAKAEEPEPAVLPEKEVKREAVRPPEPVIAEPVVSAPVIAEPPPPLPPAPVSAEVEAPEPAALPVKEPAQNAGAATSLSSSYAPVLESASPKVSEESKSPYVPFSGGRYKPGFKSKYQGQKETRPVTDAPVSAARPASSPVEETPVEEAPPSVEIFELPSSSVEIFEIEEKDAASLEGGAYSTYGAETGY
ncbi:MAG: type II and III secretion system family protein [Rhodospirillales bacterium]|nr:type II and III secretion system family protein [Alphaproteobacteria bacterium]USO03736.1 MAG: type II and III secretion system family protein [Rhodospirillales bacterium]